MDKESVKNRQLGCLSISLSAYLIHSPFFLVSLSAYFISLAVFLISLSVFLICLPEYDTSVYKGMGNHQELHL